LLNSNFSETFRLKNSTIISDAEGEACQTAKPVLIGILAIQGDFEAHGHSLDKLGTDGSVERRLVRVPGDFAGLDGIILPGGESTTHIKLVDEENLREPLMAFAKCGGAIFGTCAGAILLAREVRNPPQPSLGLMDIAVLRNGYGRQLASGVQRALTRLKDGPLEMVFIRAPIIESTGAAVEILAEADGHPVLVRQGRILAATFHPELTVDTAVHEYFLRLARNGG